MRPINAIIIHAADTPPVMDIGAEEIRRWHVDGNGWADIGYHHVICRNGAVEEGRPIETPGAHVSGRNADSIGICLVGGRGENGRPDCNFTAAQWSALEALVGYYSRRFPDAIVRGHRDYDDHKACPCFDAAAWWSHHKGAAA